MMKVIPKSLTVLFSGAILVFLVSCSHPIEIVGEGDVTSASGDRDCYLEDFQAGNNNCSKNYVAQDYSETYYALPREGWQFHRWISCIGAVDNTCTFDVPADTVQQFWGQTMPPLRAVFIDPVVVDGKEWLQPDLFITGYTREQINAVCPGGVCSGALPGSDINLTGYMWASVEDINALFNHYAGYTLLGPGPDESNLGPWQLAREFVDAGWRSFSDSEPGVGGLIFSVEPSEVCAAAIYEYCGWSRCGTFVATNISCPEANHFGGAWFYRTL